MEETMVTQSLTEEYKRKDVFQSTFQLVCVYFAHVCVKHQSCNLTDNGELVFSGALWYVTRFYQFSVIIVVD